MRDYLELTKPTITWLILGSTAVGYYFGLGGGDPRWLVLFNTLLGTGLLASGTATLNEWYERDADAKMRRTEARPIPSGRVTPGRALAFGIVLSVLGFADLALAVNRVAALWGLATLATYLLLYTPLKQRTPHATTIGAFPGAMPPLIGFAAAAGGLSAQAWVLFAILFLWQFPHFLAIAWMYREDYGRAGIVMLPVVEPDGKSTARQIVIASLLLDPRQPRARAPAHDGHALSVRRAGAGPRVSDRRAAGRRRAHPAARAAGAAGLGRLPASALWFDVVGQAAVVIVSVENLTRQYGARTALAGVSFEVREGEIFGVLGPNGGGKSTLFRILATMLAPSTGSASVAGFDVERQPSEVRRRIGVVFQSQSLDKKLTVFENLRAQGHLFAMHGRVLAERIDEVAARLGLADRRNDLVDTLSGGLRRRVEIAKGLLHRPTVLLMDEPSTGLDPGARRELWQYVEELARPPGHHRPGDHAHSRRGRPRRPAPAAARRQGGRRRRARRAEVAHRRRRRDPRCGRARAPAAGPSRAIRRGSRRRERLRCASRSATDTASSPRPWRLSRARSTPWRCTSRRSKTSSWTRLERA